MSPNSFEDYSAPPGCESRFVRGSKDLRFSTLFETKARESAEAFYDKLYGPIDLEMHSSGSLDMVIEGFEFEGLNVNAIRHGVPTSAKIHDLHPFWVFSYLSSGSVRRTDTGKDYSPGQCVVRRPGEDYGIAMSADMEMVNLRISREDMNNSYYSLHGSYCDNNFQFESATLDRSLAASTLVRIIRRLATTPLYPQSCAYRLERTLKETALFELLLAWPNGMRSRFDNIAVAPASIRRALEFIHGCPETCWSLGEVAAAACVSVRALTKGFEKHLGTSPMQYMLELRLQGVRRDLAAATWGVSVTELAMKWDFSHLGQFAARYRRRFGESPRDTLRPTKA